MSDAASLLGDILSLCNEAPMTECPHITLSHVTDVPGYVTAESAIMAELIACLHMEDPNRAIEHAAHTVAVAIALGYAIGAGKAYEGVLAAEVIVPDSLAALDFVEDE